MKASTSSCCARSLAPVSSITSPSMESFTVRPPPDLRSHPRTTATTAPIACRPGASETDRTPASAARPPRVPSGAAPSWYGSTQPNPRRPPLLVRLDRLHIERQQLLAQQQRQLLEPRIVGSLLDHPDPNIGAHDSSPPPRPRRWFNHAPVPPRRQGVTCR